MLHNNNSINMSSNQYDILLYSYQTMADDQSEACLINDMASNQCDIPLRF